MFVILIVVSLHQHLETIPGTKNNNYVAIKATPTSHHCLRAPSEGIFNLQQCIAR